MECVYPQEKTFTENPTNQPSYEPYLCLYAVLQEIFQKNMKNVLILTGIHERRILCLEAMEHEVLIIPS